MVSPLPRIPPALPSGGRSRSAVPSSSASAASPVALHFPANSRISRFSYDADSSGQHVHVHGHSHTTASPRPPLLHPPATSLARSPSVPATSSAFPPSSLVPPLASTMSSSPSLHPSLRQRNTASFEPSPTPSGRALLAALSSELKAARRRVRLVTAPLATLSLFASIVWEYLHTTATYLLSHRVLLYSLLSISVLGLLVYLVPGPHQPHLSTLSQHAYFAVLWLTLGVLSSVGLGTGLHTFVLYLGPYIAKTTLAVTECNTLDVALSGPEAFLCPTHHLSLRTLAPITFTGLLWKVAPAALLWGAGTAMGELPPYFVSRAATLSGQKLAELDALTEVDEASNPSSPSQSSSSSAAAHHPPKLSIADRVKLLIYHALQRYGFWAIVLFASIPNPLFDLAGLACGHFLIPFWTFFGATVLGKAVIKAQMQTALVIVAFNRERLEAVVHALEQNVQALRGKLGPFFERQRAQFHTEGAASGGGGAEDVNYLSLAWNAFLISMILFFVASIVDSSVQERLATRDQAKIERLAQEKGIELKNDRE